VQRSLKPLAECCVRVAAAMGQPAPDPERLHAFLVELLFGQREFWLAHEEEIILDTELRDVVMAHVATWISAENDTREPGSDTWSTRELERAFELALLGRAIE
jgi:hypothetical protein